MIRIADSSHNQRLDELRKTARPCFQCGICASSCPVFRVAPELNPRVSVDSIITEGVVPTEGNEWLCAYCLMCEERCPMGVSLAEILMGIKNMSAQAGRAPPDVVDSAEALYTRGCLSPVSNRAEKKREDLGLPQLPEPDPEQVKLIFDATGALEVLEANRAAAKEESE